MDVNTGRLMMLDGDEQGLIEEALERQRQDNLEERLRNLTPVPSELENAAKKKLAGKKEAMVSLTSGGKLSEWAAKERKKLKRFGRNSNTEINRRRVKRRNSKGEGI